MLALSEHKEEDDDANVGAICAVAIGWVTLFLLIWAMACKKKPATIPGGSPPSSSTVNDANVLLRQGSTTVGRSNSGVRDAVADIAL